MDNAVLKSAISSVVLYLIGMAAGKLGLTPDQVTGLSNAVVTIIFVGGGSLVALLVTLYKARQHTKAAQILAVNAASNGVVAVPTAAAQAAGIPAATGPLK